VSLCRDEWDLCKNYQPLVLVGRGFGTLVLDKLFLKATEELLTRPTEAGAFVRNVRGVTLYEDNIEDHTKSYEIEKFFGGEMKHVNKFKFGHAGSFHHVTQGSMLINPAVYGKNLTHVRIQHFHIFRKVLWCNVSDFFFPIRVSKPMYTCK